MNRSITSFHNIKRLVLDVVVLVTAARLKKITDSVSHLRHLKRLC